MGASYAKTTESTWKPLYRIGSAAALIIVGIMVIQIIVYIASPPPTTVLGYFTLFHRNGLLGLLSLDLLYLVDNALVVLLYLALYAALRRVSPSFMAIALALGLIGSAAYFASNTSFEMLSLSSQYAAATTDAQRSLFQASGQAMLAIYQGSSFDVYYILGAVATLIISVVMLRSNIFGKAGTTVPNSGVQEITANAMIHTDSIGDFFHIGAACLTNGRHGVDIRDLQRQE